MPAAKRKAQSPVTGSAKRPRPDYADRSQYKDSTVEARHGIVIRECKLISVNSRKTKHIVKLHTIMSVSTSLRD